MNLSAPAIFMEELGIYFLSSRTHFFLYFLHEGSLLLSGA